MSEAKQRRFTPGKKPARYGENVFRIHENPKAGVPGGHLAAAFMGALARNDFAQLVNAAREAKILWGDMPTKGSNLTIKQHTFQAQGIRRFCLGGVVDLYNKLENRNRRAGPKNKMFCAIRAWHQGAEDGYMKRIERSFQNLARDITEGRVTKINGQNKIVDEFYALWYARSRLKYLPSLEVGVQGVDGASYTIEEEEYLERYGRFFTREGGRIPARQINGLYIQMYKDDIFRRMTDTTDWKILTAQEGEFVVPDIPTVLAIPVTPTLCLFSTATGDGMITNDVVANLNRQFKETSWEYFFARDLGACP
ncbi:MAG TPA: hypothetical protein VHW66_09400 [Stellaceae bacterium]|jgi:hypothetical protein|nr:hypothetical protein [Stellaceae bacterium]